MSIWTTLKSLIFGPPLKDQFEKMIAEEATTVLEQVTPVVEPAAAPVVEDQITDAVTEQAPVKPKRARTSKGRMAKDDPTTPDINEAWEGGKAPAKKRTSKKRKQ